MSELDHLFLNTTDGALGSAAGGVAMEWFRRVMYFERVVAVRQAATLAARTWIDDCSQFVLEGADTWAQEIAEWFGRTRNSVRDSARAVQAQVLAWLAARRRGVTVVAVLVVF